MDEQDKTLIHLNGVSKIFYTEDIETRALYDLQLEINLGEYVSIIGPSGCGKSTLLSLIGLLDSPTEGKYMLDGIQVSEISANQRAHIRNQYIGFIFQAFNLISDLNVLENVQLPMTYRRLSSDKRRKLAMEALERVGMTSRVRHFPSQLSGGQQQRVAVARAIIGEPKILLADEPTGNLDSTNGEAVMEQLKKLHTEGATICIVTHDPRYAAFADRRITLRDGHIVEEIGLPQTSSRGLSAAE